MSFAYSPQLFAIHWVDLSLEVRVHVVPVHWAGAFDPEPGVYAGDVEDVAALREHSELISYFELVHADAALRELLQLLADLLVWRLEDVIDEIEQAAFLVKFFLLVLIFVLI